MTITIQKLPASEDHVSPYPVVPSAPCCGRPVTDYEPPVPSWALNGMVVEQRQAMDPALRGLAATRPWQSRIGPRVRLGSCGCDAQRTAMSGLGTFNGFTEDVIAEATAVARTWASSAGFTLPPTPSDVIGALWQLAQTERDLEVLRQKLRAMRAAGIPLTGRDTNAYKVAADAYYNAAVQMYTPLREIIRTASPAAASIIPPISRPPSLDAPDRPIPWVPTEADMARIRSGDMTGITGRFGTMVDTVRARVSGSGMRGLGLFGIDDLTIGVLVLIVLGLLALAATAIAAAYTFRQLASVVIAWTATKGATEVATRRREVYDNCVSGGGSGSACAADAERVVPMPVIPPAPSPVNVSASGVVAVVAIGAAAYYFLGTSGGRKMVGLSGFKKKRRW